MCGLLNTSNNPTTSARDDTIQLDSDTVSWISSSWLSSSNTLSLPQLSSRHKPKLALELLIELFGINDFVRLSQITQK